MLFHDRLAQHQLLTNFGKQSRKSLWMLTLLNTITCASFKVDKWRLYNWLNNSSYRYCVWDRFFNQPCVMWQAFTLSISSNVKLIASGLSTKTVMLQPNSLNLNRTPCDYSSKVIIISMHSLILLNSFRNVFEMLHQFSNLGLLIVPVTLDSNTTERKEVFEKYLFSHWTFQLKEFKLNVSKKKRSLDHFPLLHVSLNFLKNWWHPKLHII